MDGVYLLWEDPGDVRVPYPIEGEIVVQLCRHKSKGCGSAKVVRVEDAVGSRGVTEGW